MIQKSVPYFGGKARRIMTLVSDTEQADFKSFEPHVNLTQPYYLNFSMLSRSTAAKDLRTCGHNCHIDEVHGKTRRRLEVRGVHVFSV